MEKDIEKLKYPIGKFQKPQNVDKIQIEEWIKTIEEFPDKVNNEVKNLTEKELEKRYRPNGWTIYQVINHCADSHMNSLIRFKLTLTEETPTIKPYFENLWAELSDSKNYPVESSLKILAGLHERWVHLMENLTEIELEKEFIHPENKEKVSLKTNIGIYAWHCKHHLAHIISAKQN
ncbi:DinB family protein [Anseongella ginsenosidimutans]|uniref:DinB family protein n=1 Tax=Anseongella ginsenosidimutans TaxID=496056 RepID=A0A4R3KT33_9SPHI|nr:putative metal-dependent hydrolase [Anseongella ginsenosidimutans]QEC53046.1 putative metal-dependent hydrolase [Anseongella ginsenosidimutans]TCS87661.1 DinB family protein [Anseongella ginsenosidimutans]